MEEWELEKKGLKLFKSLAGCVKDRSPPTEAAVTSGFYFHFTTSLSRKARVVVKNMNNCCFFLPIFLRKKFLIAEIATVGTITPVKNVH